MLGIIYNFFESKNGIFGYYIDQKEAVWGYSFENTKIATMI